MKSSDTFLRDKAMELMGVRGNALEHFCPAFGDEMTKDFEF